MNKQYYLKRSSNQSVCEFKAIQVKAKAQKVLDAFIEDVRADFEYVQSLCQQVPQQIRTFKELLQFKCSVSGTSAPAAHQASPQQPSEALILLLYGMNSADMKKKGKNSLTEEHAM